MYVDGKKVYRSRMEPPVLGFVHVKDSNSIRNIQTALYMDVTGNYDEATWTAIAAFQRKQGWTGTDADGIPGKMTVERLGLVWVDDVKDEPSNVRIVRSAVRYVKHRYRRNWKNPNIAGKGTFNPKYVILHHTAGLNSLNYIESGTTYAPVPAANFLINKDGTVEVISSYKTYHAGLGGPYKDVPKNDMNSYSFGIEVESLGRVQDFTDAQTYALAALTRGLLDAMDEPYTNALNHKTWSSTGKVDTRYPDSYWRDKIAATKPLMPKVVAEPVIVPVKELEVAKTMEFGSYSTVKTNTPTDKQILSLEWTDITGCTFVPGSDGLVLSRVYANLTHDKAGIVRFRLVDGTGKNVYYQDVDVNELAITKGNHLIGASWFGQYSTDQGQLRWQIRSKGFNGSVSTRYSEWALIKPLNVV